MLLLLYFVLAIKNSVCLLHTNLVEKKRNNKRTAKKNIISAWLELNRKKQKKSLLYTNTQCIYNKFIFAGMYYIM